MIILPRSVSVRRSHIRLTNLWQTLNNLRRDTTSAALSLLTDLFSGCFAPSSAEILFVIPLSPFFSRPALSPDQSELAKLVAKTKTEQRTQTDCCLNCYVLPDWFKMPCCDSFMSLLCGHCVLVSFKCSFIFSILIIVKITAMVLWNTLNIFAFV